MLPFVHGRHRATRDLLLLILWFSFCLETWIEIVVGLAEIDTITGIASSYLPAVSRLAVIITIRLQHEFQAVFSRWHRYPSCHAAMRYINRFARRTYIVYSRGISVATDANGTKQSNIRLNSTGTHVTSLH